MTPVHQSSVDTRTETSMTDIAAVIEQAIEKVSGLCSFTPVSEQHQQLLENINKAVPEFSFHLALSRGGWYRLGGLLNADDGRVSDKLQDWIEQECSGDVNELTAEYADAGYVVTYIHGKTLYLVAQVSETSEDFIQLEIEELQEKTDHLLFNDDILPDDIADLVDPVERKCVEARSVGEPRYVFRRMTYIADYLRDMSAVQSKVTSVRRFIKDWARSSASEAGVFSDYWVLGIREYTDAYGELIMIAQPVCKYTGEIPRLEKAQVKGGTNLANMIHGFDRDMGYPMAWYFYMLTNSKVPYQLVEAIHDDQMGAYDYLPAKDLKVLIDWYNKPYSV